MPERRRRRSVLISAAAGAACLALATPAWAAASDPGGANGTVKIDGVPLTEGTANEPHVSCDFNVEFFGFDQDQRADIIFAAQAPTGSTELLRRDNVLISDDPAGGAKLDPDASIPFSADQLGLDAFTPQRNQGFHVKLTIDLIGVPGAGKHKVYWIQLCEKLPSSPPGSPPPSSPENPPSSPAVSGAAGGGLPVTGSAISGIALLGGAMVAGGTALLIIRRRRDASSTS
jgi:LPXTG-motif cell wall-anchored protein